MSIKELGKLFNEHFITPLNRTIGLFLWISFDWLGNPSKLFFGILAGFRELFKQPWKKGIRGIPRGIEVCLCSVFGSLFDSLARIINSMFKGIDRTLRIVHTRVGVKTVRQGTLILSLSRAPIGKRDGFKRGTLLALLQCRTVFLNMREIVKLFITRGRKRYRWTIVYFFVFTITLVLTFCLGIIEALLLFLYNVLQGLVVSLYRRSAEDVCDWDPIQLVALEMPVGVRPPMPEWAEMGELYRGSVMAPFAYLPALVREQMDPEEGLVPPWQWQRWSSGDQGGGEAVLSAIWCGVAETRKSEAMILYETETHFALMQVRHWREVKAGLRPRKPRAIFTTLWQSLKGDLESIKVVRVRGEAGTCLLRLQEITDVKRTVAFSSEQEAYRAFELLSHALIEASRR